ncbi:MAG: YihY/virulence factor BrkB family protein [Sphingomonadales bacterium]|nr:YihY/virulence factor BrkB family protein [Sphingomonadales bacterium]
MLRAAPADPPTDRREPERGHLGATGWFRVLGRVWSSSSRHDIGFLSAGVAFFAFLSMAPGLSLVVMLYGLIADPATIFHDLTSLIRLMPAQAAKVIVEQAASLIKTAALTHGIAIVPAVLLALYGASGAARGIISSLNMIYDREEKRGWIRLTVVAIGIAAAAVIVALLGLMIASATAFVQTLLPGIGTLLARALIWLAGAALATLVVALLYRYGPCRAQPRWRWLTLGSLAATGLWLAISILFGWYVRFASYGSTYGSLATVVALLMWLYFSAYAVLLGAIFEAEAERGVEAAAQAPAGA